MPRSAAQSQPNAPAPTASPLVRSVQLCAKTQQGELFTDPPTRDELRSVCRGLLTALDEERKAASKAATHLGAGMRLRVVGSGSLYQFSTSGPLDTSAGDPALVRIGEREVEGVVVSCAERLIEVTLSEDLGATVPAGGELLLDAPWMVSRLRQRVSEAFEIGLETPRLFNLTNALRTLGIGEIPVSSIGLTPVFENERRPLNEVQERALSVAMRSPLSLLASPAGTGKTLTLGALIESCYRAGLRTLVSAPSNVAVDLLMRQASERLAGEPGFDEAEVLRLGVDAGATLRLDFGPNVILDEVMARLRPKLQSRIELAQTAVDDAAAALTAARKAAGRESDDTIRVHSKALTAARADLREVRRQARDYGRNLTASAKVVGATLARVFLDSHLGAFDVVIIDEASMAHGPAVFVAAGLARRHVVIGGDPFQLSAPVKSNGPNRHWLAEDVFQRLDVLSAIRDEEDVPYLTQLTEQRRSAPAICELLGKIWYGPSLRTAPEVIRRERDRTNVLFGTSALCYIDTSSLGAKAYHPWGHTFANEEHAALVADLIAYLASAGELPAGAPDGSEVLVMSHYRGQVAAIRRHLGSRYRNRGVAVRTVHRTQGAEASTAILDLTLTPQQPTRVSSVFTAVRPEHEGSRLLAVAASRARSRLIILGDVEWIEGSVAAETVLGRICAHLLEEGQEITVGEVRRASTAPSLHVGR